MCLRLKAWLSQVLDLLFLNFEAALVCVSGKPIESMNFYLDPTDAIWSIDKYARIGFPLVFLVIQTCYWAFYLYLS